MKKNGIFSLLLPLSLLANPSHGEVKAGSAAIHHNDNVLEITASDRTILHWDEFSIQKGETTRFVQPDASSTVLNRVVGLNHSEIHGILQANGKVVLVNPHGIYIGKEAVIQTADFVAATFDILDLNDFTIQTNQSDYLHIPQSGGYAAAINHEGVIHASSVENQGGRIMLVAPHVHVEGELIASHGTVELLGSLVVLDNAARVNTSCDLGGGIVRIGGDYQGKNEQIPNSQAVFVGPNVYIESNGHNNSDGGKVILWSDLLTAYQGKIEAKGGEFGGDGGFVEISSKGQLGFSGHVDTTAPLGHVGSLVLDPCNVTIDGVGGTTVGVMPAPPFPPCPGCPITFTFPAMMGVTINSTDLGNAVQCCDVTIDATTGGGTAATGTITLNPSSNVNWTNGNSLTLIADGAISLFSDIATTGAGAITVNSTASTVTIGSAAAMTSSNIQSVGGAISITGNTGVQIIGGANAAGSITIESGALAVPVFITADTGDVNISSISSGGAVAVINIGSGASGLTTVQATAGDIVVTTDLMGQVNFITNDALDLLASSDLFFNTSGDSSITIQVTSMTGGASRISATTGNWIATSNGNAFYQFTYMNSPLTVTTGQNMQLLSNSTTFSGFPTLGRSSTFNIGQDLLIQDTGAAQFQITGNQDLTFNVQRNATFTVTSNTNMPILCQGTLNMTTITGDISLDKPTGNSVPPFDITLAGVAGVNIVSGGDISLGRLSNIFSVGSSIFVQAQNNVSVGSTSNIGTFMPPLPGATLVIVVDNQAPAPPAIGLGGFSLANGGAINGFFSMPTQIFTARRSQNTIAGTINGMNFSPNPAAGVDTNTEHWSVYFPNAFIGAPPEEYTIFYKESGFPTPPTAAVLIAIASPALNTVFGEAFIVLEEFAHQPPFFDDHFDMHVCNPPQTWTDLIQIDNYRKFYPNRGKIGLVNPKKAPKSPTCH